MKTRKLLGVAIFLIAALICTGCASSTAPPEIKQPRRPTVFDKRPRAEGLVIKDARDYEEGFIKETIGIMTEEHKAAARGVTIVVYHNNDVTHFEDDNTIGGVIVGHYHRKTKEICLRSKYLDRETVWHEVCHAYHDTLSEDFDNQWQDVAGDVYEKDYEKVKFPRRGLLKKYASYSYIEDIATWVEEIYSYVAELYMSHNFGKIDRSEEVYLQKLDLLLKWKFINEEDYLKIKPMLVDKKKLITPP